MEEKKNISTLVLVCEFECVCVSYLCTERGDRAAEGGRQKNPWPAQRTEMILTDFLNSSSHTDPASEGGAIDSDEYDKMCVCVCV